MHYDKVCLQYYLYSHNHSHPLSSFFLLVFDAFCEQENTVLSNLPSLSPPSALNCSFIIFLTPLPCFYPPLQTHFIMSPPPSFHLSIPPITSFTISLPSFHCTHRLPSPDLSSRLSISSSLLSFFAISHPSTCFSSVVNLNWLLCHTCTLI